MSDVGRLVADRYRLVEHIGSGAMGVVWQAHDERLHRTVALKQLLLQPGLSQADANEARERAMREGRIAARLQHPNAVSVYDVVEDDGQPVLIMEYVPSRSLSAVLDERGPLAPAEVARIGAQVATALTAAHAAGIVHRDIKPGNVLLADDGNVKITDFGISRATGDVTVTATGMLAGTPAYLAPEVAKGENPGPPSDVFSLASTLYAAVEGQPPFGFIDNTLALLHAVAACRTLPPKQAGPLTGLLNHMLRAQPTERPSMPEVTQALNAVAAGQSTPAAGFAAAPPSGPNAFAQPGGQFGPGSGPNQFGPPRGGPPTGPTRLDGATERTRLGPATPPPGGFRQPPPPRTGPGSGGYPLPVADGPPWKKWVLTALAIAAAAVVGILVASLFTGNGGNSAAASSLPTVTKVAPTTTTDPVVVPSITITPQTGTQQPTDAASTSTIGTPAFPAMRTALLAYYALLPKQPQAAWSLLSPAAQAAVPGGYAAYAKNWTTVTATHVDAVVAHGSGAVLARVTLTGADKKTSTTNYQISFVQENGQTLINNAKQIGKTSGGPTKGGKPKH